jgi:hypothetical protein
MTRQQVLYLWLAEGALDTQTVAWAFYDGAKGLGPALPEGEPPYATGLKALEDGWCLFQSPAPYALTVGSEHEVSYLPNEFVFERRIALDA